MHTTKEKILKKLIYTPHLGFNELWNQKGESNNFAYHLRILEEDGLIEKNKEKYSLTLEGKKYALYMRGETGKIEKAPLTTVAIIIYDKKTDKVLMQKRTKEPFYGLWITPAGKLEHDQFILECAKEEVKSETGLDCDLSLKGLISIKTFTKDELVFNHNLFIVKGENPRGELVLETREGKNKWMSLNEVKELKSFPNMKYNMEIAFGDGFRTIDFENTIDNDEFIKFKILRDERFDK